jgi:lambda family phage portal protein
LATTVNDSIETAWEEWSRADSCHTGGALSFPDLERTALAEVFTSGEAIIRKHYRAFGDSKVPFALELIEAERLLDDTSNPAPGVQGKVRMGVELDDFGRAVAYYFRARHPGDRRWAMMEQDRIIRVPAAEIIHLRIVDRWPMTRGEPWMCSVMRKLDDMDQYSASEVQAARASSYYFGTIESPEAVGPLQTSPADGTQPTMEIESGLIQQLMPGEKLEFHSPNRPNQALDPFMRYMLREIASGLDVPYETLSNDYSQSNYSSSRLSLLDARDTWRVLQRWWLRSFREPLHREWLQTAVLSRSIQRVPIEAYIADRARYEAALFKVRGWGWVDPTKEVAAYKEAVMAGFTTITDVISQTAGGQDIEDVINTRKRELEMLDEAGIDVDTTVEEPQEPAPAPAPAPVAAPAAKEPEDTEDQAARPARVVSLGR